MLPWRERLKCSLLERKDLGFTPVRPTPPYSAFDVITINAEYFVVFLQLFTTAVASTTPTTPAVTTKKAEGGDFAGDVSNTIEGIAGFADDVVSELFTKTVSLKWQPRFAEKVRTNKNKLWD